MKIRITSNPITQFGDFTKGQIIDDSKYPLAFLNHLVNDCGAAEFLDYETKIDMEYEPVKKPPSSPSLELVKVSQKKTRGRPRKTPK